MSASGKRGLRNNNPGNIRISDTTWLGKVPVSQNTDGTFEQFTTMEYGARAMLKILITYIDTYHLITIPQIINRWAPASDGNNPATYAQYVSDATGISLTTILDTSYSPRLINIGAAMAQVENGKTEALAAGVDSNLFAQAWNLI
jgi:hypothetical protein